jgi:hypothetical protein
MPGRPEKESAVRRFRDPRRWVLFAAAYIPGALILGEWSWALSHFLPTVIFGLVMWTLLLPLIVFAA